MLDFLYDLFSPRKSAAIITRNEVLEEVEKNIKIDSVNAISVMSRDMKFSTEVSRGYFMAMKDVFDTIENLKK